MAASYSLLLSEREAASFIGIDSATFTRLRSSLPPPVVLGNVVRWRRDDLSNYVDNLIPTPIYHTKDMP